MAVSTRNWAAIAVIMLWGVALGWLGLRRLGQTDASRISAQASLRLAPGDAWFRVQAGPIQFGYAGITLDTMADGSYRIREQLNLELPGDGALDRVIRSTEYYLGSGLAVDSLVSRAASALGNLALRAVTRDGAWETALLVGDTLTVASGIMAPIQRGATRPFFVPLAAVPLRLGLVGAIAAGDGRTYAVADGWPPAGLEASILIGTDSVAVFADSSDIDPATGRWTAATFDTVVARQIRLTSPAGPVRLAVDRRGTVVGLEHPLGARWIREDFNVARFNFRNAIGPTGEGIRAGLPVLRRLAGSALAADTTREIRRWQVTRRDGTPLDTTLFTMLSGGRQVALASGLLIVRPSAQSFYPGRDLVHPDPFIQEDDSAVVALADTLRDALEGRDLRTLTRELRARVRVDNAATLPLDAAGALRTGRTGPDGLARLATALLRQRGVPARYVVGILPVGDTLYTHSWVEVPGRGTRSDTWDPLTGAPASSGLIRLARAGSSHPHDLLMRVADVRFTPTSASAPEGEGP